MKFTTAFIASVLTASALAAPTSVAQKARQARRAAGLQRTTKPMIPANVTSAIINGPNGETHPEYSTNWAGAALVGSGYTGVYGTFVVPEPRAGNTGSANTAYSASAWVGIDGYTCANAILQTGVDFNYEGGSVSFDAWYEWFPDYAYDFSGISFSVGDTVTLGITATSTTAGRVTVENVSTGKSVSHSFSRESAALCETNAEWIVEDFTQIASNGAESLVPLVDFGTVTFTDAYATTRSGRVGITGAQIIDMIDETGSNVVADASVSGSEVIVTYAG